MRLTLSTLALAASSAAMLLMLSLSLSLAPTALAFGASAPGGGGVFQSNPFNSLPSHISPEDAAKLTLETAKREANANLPDPTPGEVLTGPSVHKLVDAASRCSVGTLHATNEARVRPVLSDLVATTFFRYFKVDTEAECPFWVMDRMCKSGGGCHVCRCDEREVPLPWRVEPTHRAVRNPLPTDFRGWDDVDQNMWAHTQADFAQPDAVYVNLLDNPESNTGYAGAEPRRIWDAIYQENCFRVMATSDVARMCLEERVFYRLLSGLHTSITVHVFARWKRDAVTNEWLRNQGVWNMVFGRFPERLDNLYFTLDFLLRSLRLAAPHAAEAVAIDTGHPEEDARTRTLFAQLVGLNYDAKQDADTESNSNKASDSSAASADSTGVTPAASAPVAEFDQAFSLFESHDKKQLKDDLKNMFRNVSVIMNCVGCEKCRVWGKLNTLGIATALKISLAQSPAERAAVVRALQRNEVVAWVNTLASFSEAVHFVSLFTRLDYAPAPSVTAAAAAAETSQPAASAAIAPADGKATESKIAATTSATAAAAAAGAETAATASLSDAVTAAAAAASRVLRVVLAAVAEPVEALRQSEPHTSAMYGVTTALLLVGAAVFVCL